MKKSKREHIIDDIHRTPDVAYIENPSVSHEKSDVDVRSIIMFAGGLLVFGVIVHILMWFMFNFMEDRARKSEPPPRPMALKETERMPPEPRLQAAPGFGINLGEGKQPVKLELREPQAEYNEMSKIWMQELEGKPDPRTGQVSMPIEEAKQKIISDGQLRTRPQAAGQQQIDVQGMDIPSYQSSGRMTEKRDQ
ncbi:MAG: hypothetical protein QOH49_2310 [Acidobacteriota bacterium]|jgi:hypothetical protein|nr:hypothetical protein [Acidobacteriota bacterium]